MGNSSTNLSQTILAVEEYAYNTDTSTTLGDTSKFGYGPTGAQIQNITANLSRRVRFVNPIQPTDMIIVEVKPSGSNNWVNVSQGPVDSSNNAWIYPWTYQNAVTYGLGRILQVASSTTDLDIAFGQYAFPSSTYGAAGQAWGAGSPAAGAAFWRVRKVSGATTVGTSVNAQYVVGSKTGIAPVSGYIGEKLTSSNLANTTLSVSGTTYNAGSVTLTTGVWMVYGHIGGASPGGTTQSNYITSLSTTSATHDSTTMNRDLSSTTSYDRYFSPAPLYINVTAATQVVYLTVSAVYTGTAPITTASFSYLYGVRIA